MGLGYCKGCGAKIFWVKTVDGRNMPCNPKLLPVLRGEGGEKFINQGGVVFSGSEVPEERANSFAMRPHWGTCPAAGRFRRG